MIWEQVPFIQGPSSAAGSMVHLPVLIRWNEVNLEWALLLTHFLRLDFGKVWLYLARNFLTKEGWDWGHPIWTDGMTQQSPKCCSCIADLDNQNAFGLTNWQNPWTMSRTFGPGGHGGPTQDLWFAVIGPISACSCSSRLSKTHGEPGRCNSAHLSTCQNGQGSEREKYDDNASNMLQESQQHMVGHVTLFIGCYIVAV